MNWMDNDGIEIIDVCNKNVLHVLERSDREGAGEVYIVPVLASASTVKENISCIAQVYLVGNIQSTLAHAR
jgi:hypothetical protein